jgi:hypothetical protein
MLCLLASGPAWSDQCAALRSHIAQLDQVIARDHIANSRNLAIQNRDNYARAYNAACTGGGSGTGSGGAGSSAARNAAALGALSNVLGALGEMARANEARRAAAIREAEEARILLEQREALERARAEAQEREKRNRAAAARAEDDRKRQAMTNPWAPGGPAKPEPDNPWAPGGAAVRAASAGFRSDGQIRGICARSTDPEMCEVAEKDTRSRLPAYQAWKREQAALRDRDASTAQARLDEAIANFERQQSSAPTRDFCAEALRMARECEASEQRMRTMQASGGSSCAKAYPGAIGDAVLCRVRVSEAVCKTLNPGGYNREQGICYFKNTSAPGQPTGHAADFNACYQNYMNARRAYGCP